MKFGNAFRALVAVMLALSVAFGAGLSVAAIGTLHDKTYSVNEGTSSVWVEVTNTTYNGTVENVTVEFYGIEGDGTETLEERTNVSTNQTVELKHRVNASLYDSYRVYVEGHDAESITSGTLNELFDKTLDLTNDTTGVWLDVTNSTGVVDAEFYGVASDGTETLIDTAKLDASDGSTATYETSVDSDKYEQVRVFVEGDSAETIDAGLIARTGSGGGLLSSSLFGLPLIVWVVVGIGAYILFVDDGDGGR